MTGTCADGLAWYAPTEGREITLLGDDRPRPASWDRADHPSQVALRRYLDVAEQRVLAPEPGEWALRLDVGLGEGDPARAADLDNYAFPLATRLGGPRLASIWCTKGSGGSSTVAVGPAVPAMEPTGARRGRIRAPGESVAYKEAVRAIVADAEELPHGPVRLEIAFSVGRGRNWMNLWKPTIDALDPLLGRTSPGRDWHPRDGRVTVLGLHVHRRDDRDHDIALAISAESIRDACAGA